jgi:hypothetical protein
MSSPTTGSSPLSPPAATSADQEHANNASKEEGPKGIGGDNEIEPTTANAVSGSTTTAVDDAATSLLEDEDTVLYGSIPAMIADVMADKIDMSLAEGISSLPLLSSTSVTDKNSNSTNHDSDEGLSRSALLLQRLQKKYIRNVDILELYAQRNLFTIAMFPPRRRQRIVQAFLNNPVNHSHSGMVDTREIGKPRYLENPAITKQITTNQDNDTSSISASLFLSSSEYQYPSKEQIPTPQAVTELNEEMKQLREKLKAVRLQRNELFVACNSVEQADQVAGQSLKALVAPSDDGGDVVPVVDQVQESVAAALVQRQDTVRLTLEGQQLLERLETIKRERDENDDPDAMIDLMSASSSLSPVKHSKKYKAIGGAPPLSLEEQYREERQEVRTNTQGLVALRNLLTKKK